MHARLQELVEFLNQRREEVLTAVATDPPDPPDQELWSVADNLDHLRVVETGVSKLIHVKLSRHDGPLPVEHETASVLTRLDHVNLTDRRRRIAAPAIALPVRNQSRADALAGLAASRSVLLETLTRADGVALGAFSHPHPLFGPLDLYQWLLFVGQHERRHAAQILESR